MFASLLTIPMLSIKGFPVMLSSHYNDGSEDQLNPFLTRLDLRRQNEGWAPATYIKIAEEQYDLTVHFSMIKEEDGIGEATNHWESPTIDKAFGHMTYNSRLLAMVIINLITDNFMTTLLHSLPHTLCNDGTFVLWSLITFIRTPSHSMKQFERKL